MSSLKSVQAQFCLVYTPLQVTTQSSFQAFFKFQLKLFLNLEANKRRFFPW